MLCNITQNAMGQTQGGYLPGLAGRGGTLPGPARGVPCWGGGYPARGYPAWGCYPARGYPAGGGGTLPGGEGGTQLGQQKEYSLHGGRYASCVPQEDFLVLCKA